jgi:dTDP-4-dehydrorhamnose reductase
MQKILITGSNGLLGQKIVKMLIDKNAAKVIATSNGSNRLSYQEGYEYYPLDITNEKDVMSLIEKVKPDTVINTAAMTNVDACETDHELCWKVNVEGVKNLINACEKVKAHLIHLSTDFIFDGLNGPYKEDDSPNPLSYYGKSKLEAENLVKHSSPRWTIIRTIIIYGIADNMSRSNVVLWAKGALEKGQKINVVDDQFRSPTLAEDLAQACISAALKRATGIYHISGKEIMSIYQLVERVADFFTLDKNLISKVRSDSLNQPAKRPPYTGFIIEKAEKELDYKPHTLEQGLKILKEQLG